MFRITKHFPISNNHSVQDDVILNGSSDQRYAKDLRESRRLDASSTRYLISDCVMTNRDHRSLSISPAVQHSLLLCERIHWVRYMYDGFETCDCKIVDDHW